MLYRFDGKILKPVAMSSCKNAGWKEIDLENALATQVNEIVREDQLMVISRQKPLQEDADILALDAKGILYIFELKRWPSQKDNLLQVIRYGQRFGMRSFEELQNRYRQYCNDDTSDLRERHREYFDLPSRLESQQFNHAQKFIVVAAGTDYATVDAIRYWKGNNLPISVMTYHVYEHEGHHLIEFHSFSPETGDHAALDTDYFVVNTNTTWRSDAYKDMLAHNKASAYHDRKDSINGIRKGAIVFLYHTGVGICAMGKAIENFKETKCDNEDNAEHYVKLDMKYKADPINEPAKCVPAWEINNAVSSSYRFRQTCFSVDREVAKTIEELLKARHEKK